MTKLKKKKTNQLPLKLKRPSTSKLLVRGMYGHATCPSLTHFPITLFFNLLPCPNTTLNFKPSQQSLLSLSPNYFNSSII